MGDRRTEVNHPASGIMSFTYDPLGNVMTKQTANMAEEGKMITYTYDYHRLTGINYPDHPENNVKYYYGGRNSFHNRIGRLITNNADYKKRSPHLLFRRCGPLYRIRPQSIIKCHLNIFGN